MGNQCFSDGCGRLRVDYDIGLDKLNGSVPTAGGVVQQNKSSVEQRGGHFSHAHTGDRRIFGMMGGGGGGGFV